MRVRFLKDWQGENSASFKKDEYADIDDELAWQLAMSGIVRVKKPVDPEVEKAKAEARLIRKSESKSESKGKAK